jgi:hypothetical protein
VDMRDGFLTRSVDSIEIEATRQARSGIATF